VKKARATRPATRPKVETLPARIRTVYKQHVDYRRESALRVFVTFVVTFLLIRALTYGIRYQLLPVSNVVTSSGLHIHHFVWGIFILLLVGFVALSVNQARWHPLLAIAYAIGAALVLDEFALWLNLQDVYWTGPGRESIDAVVIFIALLLVGIWGGPFLREVMAHLFRRRKPVQQ
jgi:hypothetical protein